MAFACGLRPSSLGGKVGQDMKRTIAIPISRGVIGVKRAFRGVHVSIGMFPQVWIFLADFGLSFFPFGILVAHAWLPCGLHLAPGFNASSVPTSIALAFLVLSQASLFFSCVNTLSR